MSMSNIQRWLTMSKQDDVVDDLIRLAQVLGMHIKFIEKLKDLKAALDGFDYYKQPTEPTIENESWAIWRDTTNNITVLLVRSDEEQEGVEVA